MLLQSHVREKSEKENGLGAYIVHLLPALPDNWPNGHVRGIRARGNLGVDLDWEEGQLKSATIYGTAGQSVVVYYNGAKQTMTIPESGVLDIK